MEKQSELEAIRNRFESIKTNDSLGERAKTSRYVELMDELEHKFGSLILYPSKDDLEREDVILYRNISDSRVF